MLEWGAISAPSLQKWALGGCRLVVGINKNEMSSIGLDCVGHAIDCRGPAAQEKCGGGPSALDAAAIFKGNANYIPYYEFLAPGVDLCVTRVGNPETDAVMAIRIMSVDNGISVVIYSCRRDGADCQWIRPSGCRERHTNKQMSISGQWVVPASDSWIVGAGFYIQNGTLALQFETRFL
jgi:hypothetical protein